MEATRKAIKKFRKRGQNPHNTHIQGIQDIQGIQGTQGIHDTHDTHDTHQCAKKIAKKNLKVANHSALKKNKKKNEQGLRLPQCAVNPDIVVSYIFFVVLAVN